jgi:hypothetical protein
MPEGDGPYGYKPYPDRYVCFDFAIDVAMNAILDDIDTRIITIQWENSNIGHAFVQFTTSDRGTMWIEPQSDYAYIIPTHKQFLCFVTDPAWCWNEFGRVISYKVWKPQACSHTTWQCKGYAEKAVFLSDL